MKLYNTLSRQLEELTTTDKTIKIYSCGPTVYDYAHIGNLRAFIFADTLRRVIEASGYSVKQVMNITDVGHLASDGDEGDDKLEKGAAREGKSVWDVADQYTQAFLTDAKELNILPPNGYHGQPSGYARATDFINTQIAMVQLLIDKGYAYQTTQAIYFDVTKLEDYGKLSGQKLGDKEVGARSEVIVDKHKQHPYDFAVWFFTVGRFKDHIMHWASPWGPGFPGWHLECSAIVHDTLGEPIDIHTGGVDHIGTHHTNEIAQTEAAYGTDLAHIWMHNEFVMVDGAKMAKSLHNFYTLRDITEKGFNPLAFRLLILQAHYRSPLNFTWKSLKAAQSFLQSLQAWADLQHQTPAKPSAVGDTYRQALSNISTSVQNDLNTPEALGWLSGLVNQSEVHGWHRADLKEFLEKIDQLFGLDLTVRHDISPTQKDLLNQRDTARQHQDWPMADKLREQLSQHHIAVRDTDFGQVWSRSS